MKRYLLCESTRPYPKRTNTRQVREKQIELSEYILNEFKNWDSNYSDLSFGRLMEKGAVPKEDGLHYKFLFWRLGLMESFEAYSPEIDSYDKVFGKLMKDKLTQFLKDSGLYDYVENIRLVCDADRGFWFYDASVQFSPDVMELVE